MDEPAYPGTVGDTQPESPVVDRPAAAHYEPPDSTSAQWLRSQHPELDWSDPEGALETLAILNDPEAMADLKQAQNDIATGNLLPLDRYAPPLWTSARI